MKRVPLLLIGAGGHAHACVDAIESQGSFQIAGLVGMPEELGQVHMGYTVFATDADLPLLVQEYPYALVAIGHIRSAVPRRKTWLRLLELGFQLPVVQAATAQVSRHARVAAGTLVMHGAIINAGASVGANCIINSRALVEHDACVGDCCHVSTGAILNGNTAVGDDSFIGSGSVLKEGVRVGAGSLVGMGLPIRHDLPANSRFVGGVQIG